MNNDGKIYFVHKIVFIFLGLITVFLIFLGFLTTFILVKVSTNHTKMCALTKRDFVK